MPQPPLCSHCDPSFSCWGGTVACRKLPRNLAKKKKAIDSILKMRRTSKPRLP